MLGQAVDPDLAPSGIRGVTVVDQGRPLLMHQKSVPLEPMPAWIRITRGGQSIAHVGTDAYGRFEVLLPPGNYQLAAVNITGAPVPTALPITMTVHPHEINTVTIQFDSGIR
jgi:hypothetical protein